MSPVFIYRLKHFLVASLCFAVFGYFIYHAIMGEKGYVALSREEARLAAAQADLHGMQEERIAMENRTRLLRPDHLDPDMLDERARAMLGYTKPNEYVVIFNDKK